MRLVYLLCGLFLVSLISEFKSTSNTEKFSSARSSLQEFGLPLFGS